MTGRDLLEAMSFIDEELVQLANTLPKSAPRKNWLTLAACLCILLLGSITLFQPDKSIPPIEEAAPEIEMAAGAGEIPSENRGYENAAPESAEDPLILLVRTRTVVHDGFTATVIRENGIFPTGTILQIQISKDSETCPLYPDGVYLIEVLYYDQETVTAASVTPYQEEIP